MLFCITIYLEELFRNYLSFENRSKINVSPDISHVLTL